MQNLVKTCHLFHKMICISKKFFSLQQAFFLAMLENFCDSILLYKFESCMVYLCKMIVSSGIFFIFSKCWFFVLLWGGRGVGEGVKGQKMVQNDKKLCLSHFISQESYIIWLSFLVHMCKMIISAGVIFHFF